MFITALIISNGGCSKTEQTSIIQQITYKTTNKDVKRIIILLAKDNPATDCTNKNKILKFLRLEIV